MKRITLTALLVTAMAGTTLAQASVESARVQVQADREAVLALEKQVWRDRMNLDWDAARLNKDRLHDAKVRYDKSRARLRDEERIERGR